MATSKVMVKVVVIVKVMMLILTKADDEGHRPNYPIFFTCPDVSPSPCHLSGAAAPNERILPPPYPATPQHPCAEASELAAVTRSSPSPLRPRPANTCVLCLDLIHHRTLLSTPARPSTCTPLAHYLHPPNGTSNLPSLYAKRNLRDTKRPGNMHFPPPRNPLRFLGRRHPPPLQTSYLSVLRVR